MPQTYRVKAPYVVLKTLDPASGQPKVKGYYEGAVVTGPIVDEASLDKHLERDWIVEVDEVEASAIEPVADSQVAAGDRTELPDGEPVPDGTTDEVLAWVGADPGRVAQALASERAREKPRTTLVTQLEKIEK